MPYSGANEDDHKGRTMSDYRIKNNRTTNHIGGIEERTIGSQFNYAVSACGSLSRSVNFETHSTHSDLAEALRVARIAGQRKLCKNCEKAALATLAGEARATIAPVNAEEATSRVSTHLHESDETRNQRSLWESCSMESAEQFRINAVAILGDRTEVGSADLRAANWTELYEWFKGTNEGDEMPPKKKTTDVDAMISEVHATIDEIKEIDPSEEGAVTHANELSSEAEEKIAKLPVAKRNTLRADVKAAREAVTKPTTEVEKATVREAENFYDVEGVPELVRLGVEKAREGVDLGIKMGSVSESVAHVILDIATRIINPDTGLPDIKKDRKTTKNAAAEIYAQARKDVADNDAQRIEAHNSLVKSVQNRNSDVLVDWLRAFDNNDDNTVLAELFPVAAALVENGDMKPSEAIRKVYADKGVTLPERGRKEIERVRAQVKRLDKARKELEVAQEEAEEGDEEAAEKAQKLAERVQSLEESLPEDAVTPTQEKTAQEKSFDKLMKAETYFTSATKHADKLSADEKADLKARINEMVSTLVAAASKL